jgi:hypothetical protein
MTVFGGISTLEALLSSLLFATVYSAGAVCSYIRPWPNVFCIKASLLSSKTSESQRC